MKKRISKKTLLEFKNFKIRLKDISAEYNIEEDKLALTDVEEEVYFGIEDALNVANKYINGDIDGKWMHEWVNAILFWDWYDIYVYEEKVTDEILEILYYLDDEEDKEVLGFNIEKLLYKVKELEKIAATNPKKIEN